MSVNGCPCVGAGGGSLGWLPPCRSAGTKSTSAPGCPQPLSPHPHPQAPTASLARLHTTRWPCPPMGLPGLAQLWHSRGHGHCPGRGPAAGWAPAQLLHTAGRALHRGGFSLPAHVVTMVTANHVLRSCVAGECLWGHHGQCRSYAGALKGHWVHIQTVPSHRSLCHGAMLGCACSLPHPRMPTRSPLRNKDTKMLFFMTPCFVLGGHGQLQQGADGTAPGMGTGTGGAGSGLQSPWDCQ